MMQRPKPMLVSVDDPTQILDLKFGNGKKTDQKVALQHGGFSDPT